MDGPLGDVHFSGVGCGLPGCDDGLGRLAHDDDLLVGHHDDAGQLREPDPHVDEALSVEQKWMR